MKNKRILSALCALAIAANHTVSAHAIDVKVNGKTIPSESIIRSGLTYTPLAPLLDALGGWETTWDSTQRRALSDTDQFTLSVPVGEDFVFVDGYLFGLNGEVFIENGRTYVPLRALANLFGADVSFTGWDTPITVTSTPPIPYTEEDFYWLSRIISAESQGESLYGQIAVGNVVLNRVASDEFPDTVKRVVFDTKNAVQFEPTANGTIYHEPTAKSILAAHLVLSGASAVGDCLYFFNPSLSKGKWIRENRTYFTTIGCHRFYR